MLLWCVKHLYMYASLSLSLAHIIITFVLQNNEQKELDDFLAEFPVFRGKSAQPAISN